MLLLYLIEENCILLLNLVDLGLVSKDICSELAMFIGDGGLRRSDRADMLLLFGVDMLNGHQALSVFLIVVFDLEDLHQTGLPSLHGLLNKINLLKAIR